MVPYAGFDPRFQPRYRRRGSGIAVVQLFLALIAAFGVGMGIMSAALGDLRLPEFGAGPAPSGPYAPDEVEPTPAETEPELPEGGPGSPQQVLRENPFYEAGGVVELDCPAPPLNDLTTEAQRTYYEQIFACLNEAWAPLLSSIGADGPAPALFVFDAPGNSPCGSFEPAEGRRLAFYCPANNTMYADVTQMANIFPVKHHVAYAMVLAHEYGHHLQNVTGIIAAQGQLGYEHPELRMQLSRRTELQASCFGGMFIRGIAASYPVEGEQAEAFEFYAYNAFGDADDAPPRERTHGRTRTQGAWIEIGFTENHTAACDSYSAPAAEVQ